MLKCIAIDDEPLALRQLTSYISKIPYLDLVAKYNNALEAQQMLAGEKVDLIFVDINMPVSYTHLDVYKRQRLRSRPRV